MRLRGHQRRWGIQRGDASGTMERQARLREALPLSNAGCGYWSALRARVLAVSLSGHSSATSGIAAWLRLLTEPRDPQLPRPSDILA